MSASDNKKKTANNIVYVDEYNNEIAKDEKSAGDYYAKQEALKAKAQKAKVQVAKVQAKEAAGKTETTNTKNSKKRSVKSLLLIGGGLFALGAGASGIFLSNNKPEKEKYDAYTEICKTSIDAINYFYAQNNKGAVQSGALMEFDTQGYSALFETERYKEGTTPEILKVYLDQDSSEVKEAASKLQYLIDLANADPKKLEDNEFLEEFAKTFAGFMKGENIESTQRMVAISCEKDEEVSIIVENTVFKQIQTMNGLLLKNELEDSQAALLSGITQTYMEFQKGNITGEVEILSASKNELNFNDDGLIQYNAPVRLRLGDYLFSLDVLYTSDKSYNAVQLGQAIMTYMATPEEEQKDLNATLVITESTCIEVKGLDEFVNKNYKDTKNISEETPTSEEANEEEAGMVP